LIMFLGAGGHKFTPREKSLIPAIADIRDFGILEAQGIYSGESDFLCP
jgi:hypothetical protein